MKPTYQDSAFRDLSNASKNTKIRVSMQKLSMFEVGKVCEGGAHARNAMETWSKCYGKRPHMRMREQPCMHVRERGTSACVGVGNTAEMLLKAGNFKQA